MPQLEHIEAIEKRLWSAADNLRANSNYASNEYFLPVMGLVFLRHAYSRYLTVKYTTWGCVPPVLRLYQVFTHPRPKKVISVVDLSWIMPFTTASAKIT